MESCGRAIEKKQNEIGRALGEWWESSKIVVHWGCNVLDDGAIAVISVFFSFLQVSLVFLKFPRVPLIIKLR